MAYCFIKHYLNKNYRKDEITSKKKPRTIYSEFDKISIEDIRKKAYGTLEDELENNLITEFDFPEDAMPIDDMIINDDYKEQPIDIFGDLDRKDALDDILDKYRFDEQVHNKGYEDGSNLMKEELENNYISKDEKESTSLIEDELNKNYDDYENGLSESNTKDFSDSDLFNLIDSMYTKKDDE